MSHQDWLKEYERLVKAAHATLAWSRQFDARTDLTAKERQANRSLGLYIRSALADASAKTLSKREMARRGNKIEVACYKLLHAYLRRHAN